MIAPGIYVAKIKNYGIRPVKTGPNAGQPAPTISFEVLDENVAVADRVVYWQGSFNTTDKEGKPIRAREIAMEALVTCGLSSPHKIPDLADGLAGNALNAKQEVQLTVGIETNSNTGEQYAKVAWVNPVGGRPMQDMMDKKTFAGFVARMGLAGDFLVTAKKLGLDSSVSPAPAAIPSLDEEIPF